LRQCSLYMIASSMIRRFHRSHGICLSRLFGESTKFALQFESQIFRGRRRERFVENVRKSFVRMPGIINLFFFLEPDVGSQKWIDYCHFRFLRTRHNNLEDPPSPFLTFACQSTIYCLQYNFMCVCVCERERLKREKRVRE